MKIIVKLDFTDEEREQITKYYRASRGEKGLPRLATREKIQEFVKEALDNQWIEVADILADTQERAS